MLLDCLFSNSKKKAKKKRGGGIFSFKFYGFLNRI